MEWSLALLIQPSSSSLLHNEYREDGGNSGFVSKSGVKSLARKQGLRCRISHPQSTGRGRIYSIASHYSVSDDHGNTPLYICICVSVSVCACVIGKYHIYL